MDYKLWCRHDSGGLVEVGPSILHKVLKYLPDARAAASRSKDRSTQVGAVVLDWDFNILSSGYNGFPRRINDEIETRHERPAKYLWTAHAEENCVAQAARNGVKLCGGVLLVTALHPCTTCSRLIIQSGIATVMAPIENANGRWNEETLVAAEMLNEANIVVYFYQEVPR